MGKTVGRALSICLDFVGFGVVVGGGVGVVVGVVVVVVVVVEIDGKIDFENFLQTRQSHLEGK